MKRWLELLQVLRQESGVRRAVEWIDSDRAALHSSQLWMLLPELLAQEVAVLDGFQVRNCLWIETLPSAMQSDILAFLALQSNRFRFNDMLLLAKRLLASADTSDFWVRQAAQMLLEKCSQSSDSQHEEVAELPDFLKKLVEAERIDAEARKDPQVETKDIYMIAPEDEEMTSPQEGEEEDYWGLKVSEESTSESDEEIIDLTGKVSALKGALENLDASAHIDEQLALLRNTSELSAVLDGARTWEMDDEVTLILVTKLLGGSKSHAWASSVMKAVLLPKILALHHQPASRALFGAVLQASESHSRAFVDAVLVPVMVSDKGVNFSQSDLIGRLIKGGMEAHMVLYICQQLFCASRTRTRLVWSEAMVIIVQAILNTQVDLDGGILHGLLLAFDNAVVELSTSLKFANLVLGMLTKHGSKLRNHKERLEELVAKMDTFMTALLASNVARL